MLRGSASRNDTNSFMIATDAASAARLQALLMSKNARGDTASQLKMLQGVTNWLVKLRLTGENVDPTALAAGLTDKAGVRVTVTDVTSSLLSKTSYRASVEVEDVDKLAVVIGTEIAGFNVVEIEDSEPATSLMSSASSLQAVLRGKSARKEAVAQLAKLEGVTKWLVKLRLNGETAEVDALAAGLSEKAGIAVTVTDVTSSLLSKTSYRASVEVENLDKLAAVTEAAGFIVEGIEEAIPITENAEATAAASTIQAIMRGKVAREDSIAQLVEVDKQRNMT